jgi:hypothetical protein
MLDAIGTKATLEQIGDPCVFELTRLHFEQIVCQRKQPESCAAELPKSRRHSAIITYSLTLQARFLVLTALVSLVLSASESNATDCPTSADEISTDRPDFTSPPTAVPTGSVQFENGVTWSAEQRSNVVEGPQTLLRVGIAHCTEIFFRVPDYVYAIGGNAPAGFSDFAASTKLQLPKFIGFDAAAVAGLSFPTGGRDQPSNAESFSGHRVFIPSRRTLLRPRPPNAERRISKEASGRGDRAADARSGDGLRLSAQDAKLGSSSPVVLLARAQ